MRLIGCPVHRCLCPHCSQQYTVAAQNTRHPNKVFVTYLNVIIIICEGLTLAWVSMYGIIVNK